jgi:hypothetical protein
MRAQLTLDTDQLVVLGGAVRAGKRSRFDLTGVCCDRDVRNADIFGA